jgi:hypothetical protein
MKFVKNTLYGIIMKYQDIFCYFNIEKKLKIKNIYICVL